MKTKWQRLASLITIAAFALLAFMMFGPHAVVEQTAFAQATPTPAPVAGFDQAAAIAKLKEQIKGKEQEPGEKVYKNLQLPLFKTMPAARLLAVMEFGYARSLGINCTHCHTPGQWEAEDNTKKQTARDMWVMMGKINGELLKGIKNLKSETPTINCTTCHRGQVIPALDLPAPPKT